MHPDLIAAQKLAYEPSGLVIERFAREKESREYAASEFVVRHQRIRFRVAKITPTKLGQFVTLWKRIDKGPIQPFDKSDPFDLVVISARKSGHFGQFVFPKSLLFEQGILAKDGKGGKRAIRVYPPWVMTDNKQAQETQEWQAPYFFEIFPAEPEAIRIQKLFFCW